MPIRPHTHKAYAKQCTGLKSIVAMTRVPTLDHDVLPQYMSAQSGHRDDSILICLLLSTKLYAAIKPCSITALLQHQLGSEVSGRASVRFGLRLL